LNLIKEINAFYKLDMPGQLSFTAQSLYMALLHVANEVYSRNITPSNPLLMAKTGIRDVKTLDKARKELIEIDLIKYTDNAKSRLAGKYYIIGLESLLVDNFQKNTGKIPEDTQENFQGSPGKKPPHIQEENIEEENNNPLITPSGEGEKPDPPKLTQLESNVILAFEYWNVQNIIVHKVLSPEIEKALKKAIKETSLDEVLTSMSHFEQMLHDKKYTLCDYTWGLITFLQRKKGFKEFLDGGEKWINYKKFLEEDKNKASPPVKPKSEYNFYVPPEVLAELEGQKKGVQA